MSATTPTKWAILIGIEYYSHPGEPLLTPRRNDKEELIVFKPLDGCVNDVLAVEQYLVGTIGVDRDHITKLLAPRPGHKHLPHTSEYEKPTYENIVYALKNVGRGNERSSTRKNKPKAGDFVYVHYSGHGAVATTIFPDLKKKKAGDVDEALVPCDITLGGQYLRDLELAALLEDLVADGLVVTAVLDCCHSGGAIRGEVDDENETGRTRGLADIYVSDRKLDRCQEWSRIKHWSSNPSWIDDPKGFVVLAACLKGEVAKETRESPHHGLLTHHLLRALRDRPVDIPSQALFEQIRFQVQSTNSFQTPDLIGDNERFFFSTDMRRRTYALRVGQEVNMSRSVRDRELRLAGGALQGVEKGYGYAILEWGFDLTRPAKRADILAKVEVISVSEDSSVARFRFIRGETIRWTDILPGCPAILNKVPIAKKSTVRFLAPDEASRAAFEAAWKASGGSQIWLQLADAKDLRAFFSVQVDASRNFTIREPMNMLKPEMEQELTPLPVADLANSMPKLITRLEHLAQFKVTKGLGSSIGAQAESPAVFMSCEVSVLDPEIEGVEGDGKFYPRAAEIGRKDGVWEVQKDTVARITFRNTSSQPLSIVVLCCTAELSIIKIFPRRFTHITLGSGQVEEVGIAPSMADELRSAAKAGVDIVDVHKVFVSSKERLLTALMLDSLKKREELGNQRASSTQWDGLEDLFDELEASRAPKPLTSSEEPEQISWGVVDVKVRVISNQDEVESPNLDDEIVEEDSEPERTFLG